MGDLTFLKNAMGGGATPTVTVEHLEREEEVFPLIAVGDKQRLGGAVVLNHNQSINQGINQSINQ